MELKQLEFFVAAYESGSLGKAAVRLYTSQPNVSKVIRSLESELQTSLFERAPEGLHATSSGHYIYRYACDMLKCASIIQHNSSKHQQENIYLSTYQSQWLSYHLAKFYQHYPEISIEHRTGNVEEIVSHIIRGISDFGILYVAQKQFLAFQNVITAKKLSFHTLGTRNACLYVGPNSPLYNRSCINFEELYKLKYVRGINDYFSIEDGLNAIEAGLIREDFLNAGISSNSEHLANYALLSTDLVFLGICVDPMENYYKESIHRLEIQGENSQLIIGYLTQQNRNLSSPVQEFLSSLQTEL